MSDGGKGSGRRPATVSDDTLADNWAKTFAKNPDNTGISKDEYYDVLTPEQALEAMVAENQRLGLYEDYNKPTRNNSETQQVLK